MSRFLIVTLILKSYIILTHTKTFWRSYMLRFQNKPDAVFSTFLERCLEESIDNTKSDLEDSTYNVASMYFEEEIVKSFGGGKEGLELIIRELEKLLAAHIQIL